VRHKWDSTLGRFVPLTKEELLIQEHYNPRRSSETQAIEQFDDAAIRSSNAGCGSCLGGSSGGGTLVSRYRKNKHEQGERHQSNEDFWRHEKLVPMQ
jgi:hypothetical protein